MSRYDPDALGSDGPLTPEKRLWCAVLFRILQDANTELMQMSPEKVHPFSKKDVQVP